MQKDNEEFESFILLKFYHNSQMFYSTIVDVFLTENNDILTRKQQHDRFTFYQY